MLQSALNVTPFQFKGQTDESVTRQKLKYSAYNKNFAVIETIVNAMSTSFSEVRDIFHNLFENSAVSSNAHDGFGYFRRICTVHTWVNGTC